MRVESTKTLEINITYIEPFKPINLKIIKTNPHQGEILLKYLTKTWAYKWESVHNQTIENFFCVCDAHLFSLIIDSNPGVKKYYDNKKLVSIIKAAQTALKGVLAVRND